MKIRIPLPGGKRIELGVVGVTEIDLSGLDQSVLDGIEKSKREDETFEQAAARLIAGGMMIDACILSGVDIIHKDSEGNETVIFPAKK